MPDDARVVDELAAWLPRTTFPPPGTELTIGVSGGADSLAAMALGVAAGCRVTAVHVDHGRRDGSDAESELVEDLAGTIGASFASHRVPVEDGPNLEARMRAVRYSRLGPEAATGHTADDQAETVLINLLRGAGLAGLGAMRPGFRRPILSLRRTDTETICTRLGWHPFRDPTNADPAFVRNRVRFELLPLLSDIARRDVVPLLVRTADHARSGSDVIAGLASELDPTDARAVAAAPLAVSATAIQRWIRTATAAEHPVDAASIARVLAVAEGRAVAAEVAGGARIARTEQRLRIEPISSDA